MPRPAVVVFDVNETLSDLTPMAERFADVGAPAHLAPLWFTSVLRDGFGLTAAGAPQPFAPIGRAVLRTVLAGRPLDRPLDDAVGHVMAGFGALPVHPDVPDGVRALRAADLRLVTLSNGAASVADGLLTRAGLRQEFEALLSVDDAGAWKPARAAYEHAVRAAGVPAGQLLLVAVHPWDLDGAARAGLQTAWISRDGSAYPAHLTPPTHIVRALPDLAERLTTPGS